MLVPPSPPPGQVLGLWSGAFPANAYYRLCAPLSVHPSATWATYDAVTHAQVDAADVVIIARPTHNGVAETIGDLQTRGKVVIADFDDDYWGAWPLPEPDRDLLQRNATTAIRMADAITVPNAALGAVVAAHTDRPVIVVPQMCRPDWWPPRPDRPDDGAIVIGLAGSASHIEDWRVMRPVLEALLTTERRVQVYCIGFRPGYLAGLVHAVTPWCPLEEYPRLINACDIVIAPLLDTPFNRCKSYGRALEAAMSGAAFVGATPVYGPLCRNAQTPIADTTADWLRALWRYADRPAAIREDAARFRAATLSRYDARRYAPAIVDLVTRIQPRPQEV